MKCAGVWRLPDGSRLARCRNRVGNRVPRLARSAPLSLGHTPCGIRVSPNSGEQRFHTESVPGVDPRVKLRIYANSRPKRLVLRRRAMIFPRLCDRKQNR